MKKVIHLLCTIICFSSFYCFRSNAIVASGIAKMLPFGVGTTYFLHELDARQRVFEAKYETERKCSSDSMKTKHAEQDLKNLMLNSPLLCNLGINIRTLPTTAIDKNLQQKYVAFLQKGTLIILCNETEFRKNPALFQSIDFVKKAYAASIHRHETLISDSVVDGVWMGSMAGLLQWSCALTKCLPPVGRAWLGFASLFSSYHLTAPNALDAVKRFVAQKIEKFSREEMSDHEWLWLLDCWS